MPGLALDVSARLVAAASLISCLGAPGSTGAAGPRPLKSAEALASDYRAFLDRGRTPAHAIAYVLERGGFRRVDASQPPSGDLAAGERLIFIDRDRSAILVVIGRRPIRTAGLRLIGAHIDTPAPRLDTTALTRQSQARIKTYRYGGTKSFHWFHRPLAIVGTLVDRSGRERRVELGLDDDFTFWAEPSGKDVVITAGSTPSGRGDGFDHLVDVLHERYQVTAADLAGAELYAVPRERAREVGLDRALIGAHGQDDRANSYVGWRALADLDGVPPITAATWLVDREEEGSMGAAGARSRFLELVTAYLIRAQGGAVTEATLHRAMSKTVVLSSDTPACVNPNWPEVQELSNAPRAGGGAALFPYTGYGGKMGGSAATAELMAEVRATFERAKLPLQFGLLGHVEAGGGGTISKYLAERGAAVVDVGVCAMSIHSPLELVSVRDLWTTYSGFKAWLGGA